MVKTDVSFAMFGNKGKKNNKNTQPDAIPAEETKLPVVRPSLNEIDPTTDRYIVEKLFPDINIPYLPADEPATNNQDD